MTSDLRKLIIKRLTDEMENLACDIFRGTSTVAEPPPAPSLDDLRKDLRRLEAQLQPPIQVTTSPYCTSRESARKHIKKPHMSENYHRRIQKKWDKRFGFVEVPAAYLCDLDAIFADMPGYLRHSWTRGRALVAHDSLIT